MSYYSPYSNFKYTTFSERKLEIEKRFFNNARIIFFVVFVLFPILINFLYNIIFGFNPVDNASNSTTSLLLLTLMGVIQLITFFYLLFKFPNYFIKSGAIILALFWILIQFAIPLIAGFIFGAIFAASSNLNTDNLSQADELKIAIGGTILQIIAYLFLIWYFFRFCTLASFRIKSVFKKTAWTSNWTYYLKRKFLNNNKKSYDIIKFLIILICGTVLAFFVNNVFTTNIHHSVNTENQDAINDILKDPIGAAVIIPLTILLAPIVEELATRQAIGLPLVYDKYDEKYMKFYDLKKPYLVKYDTKKTVILIGALFFSALFFANMHVMFSNMGDLRFYLLTSIIFVVIFWITGFNAFYSMIVHGTYNLIITILLLGTIYS